MVRVGIAGIGFMGMIHYLAYEKVPGVKVVALASRDEAKLAGDWTSIQGNFGPRGSHMDLSGLKKHRRFDDLIADPKVDLIDICLPTEFHAPGTQQALAAGKHVFVEKPIALTAADADACLAAAKKIADKTKEKRLLDAKGRPNFNVSFYALRKDGAFGSAAITSGPTFTIHDGSEARAHKCAFLYEKER